MAQLQVLPALVLLVITFIRETVQLADSQVANFRMVLERFGHYS